MTYKLPENWEIKDQRLCRIFVMNDFSAAWAFMTRVALLAEQQAHHPDWRNVWNRVEISLCTHDQGNQVTEKDIRLAEAINVLL